MENREAKISAVQALTALAQELSWKNPDVEVLREEMAEHHPVLTKLMQDCIRSSHHRGKLILPDLESFDNKTVAIFSDYSGDSSGLFYTYAFLVCAFDQTGGFTEKMKDTRVKHKLGNKEIGFKDFGMGQLQRAIPEFLSYSDALIPGILFNIVIDKRMISLFGENSKQTQRQMASELKDKGFGDWKPEVAEKLMRVVHISAFLTALLASDGQKIFWMSDHDAICPNEQKHQKMLELFCNVLQVYKAPQCNFHTVGGASPFTERHIATLDLLSLADIVAGSVEHYLTRKNGQADENFDVKQGSDKVLQWLAHDGIGLKKMNMIIRPGDNNTINSATLEFGLIDPPEDVTIIPVII